MNHNNALIFPETAPNAGTLRQLLLFFDTIVHYLPVEPDPETQPEPVLPAEFCTSYAPAPLGEERDLFIKIVSDLEKQKQNISGRMSSLALAQLSTSVSSDIDESTSSLLSAALKKGPDQERPDLELWQARVLLKLAESLDREEQEVAARLTELSGSEKELLAALKGPLDDEEEWRETSLLRTPSGSFSAGDHTTSTRARTRAFSRLYCADSTGSRPNILATGNINAAEPLLNALEKLTNKPALPLFTLPMPSVDDITKKADTWPAFIEYLKKFRELTQESLAVLTAPDPDPEKLSAAQTAWRDTVNTLCDASPQWELALYDVAPTSLSALFSAAFPGCSPPSEVEAENCGTLAVLLRR